MKKAIIIFLLGIFFLPVMARAVTISPLVFEVELEPGQSIQKIITLYNETGGELRLNGYIEIFKPKGEAGQAEIVAPDIAYQAVSWVQLPLNSLILKPGEAADALVIINVPKTAQVGGYYLAAMWQTAPSARLGETPMGVSSRVGALILLKVKGDNTEKLAISDFSLINHQGNFYNRLPVDFFTRLNNSGNIHVKPSGYLTIENIFGRVVENLPFNPGQANILPQSVRRFENIWQKNKAPKNSGGFIIELIGEARQFTFGRYKAQVNLEYGENRQRVSSKEIVFWVVPWRLLSVAAIIILIIFLWIKSRKRKR